MNITINILEVASELADKDLITAFGTEADNWRFPNGIVRSVDEDDDMTEYTEEAQEFFNRKYDYWWDFLYDQKIGADE
jgi:hypothetical protein